MLQFCASSNRIITWLPSSWPSSSKPMPLITSPVLPDSDIFTPTAVKVNWLVNHISISHGTCANILVNNLRIVTFKYLPKYLSNTAVKLLISLAVKLNCKGAAYLTGYDHLRVKLNSNTVPLYTPAAGTRPWSILTPLKATPLNYTRAID